MADDSINIIQPFDFHPCNSPRGMLYYDLNILTDDQQKKLNSFKREVVRENEKYLALHPEIRALTALVTRYVLLHRPRADLHEFVANFFARPKLDIQEEIERYIEEREPHIYEGDSAVFIRDKLSKESVEEEEETVELETMPRQLLDEILEKAFRRLGIDVDVDYTSDWNEPIVTSSTMSVVKDVISEVLGKATEYEKDDILKYLAKQEGTQEEEELTETPIFGTHVLQEGTEGEEILSASPAFSEGARTKEEVSDVIDMTAEQIFEEKTENAFSESERTKEEVSDITYTITEQIFEEKTENAFSESARTKEEVSDVIDMTTEQIFEERKEDAFSESAETKEEVSDVVDMSTEQNIGKITENEEAIEQESQVSKSEGPLLTSETEELTTETFVTTTESQITETRAPEETQ